MEQLTALFDEYTELEVGEIACVHQYISGRLEDVVEKVENHFIDRASSLEQLSTSRYLPMGEDKKADLQSQEVEASFHILDDDSGLVEVAWLFLDEERSYHDQRIAHLPTLDLQFLRSLFKADNSQRTILIAANDESCSCALSDALGRRSMPKTPLFSEKCEGLVSSRKLDFKWDEFHKNNLAWLWSNQYRPRYSYYRRWDADLRMWGYAFWNKDRLDRLGILEEERPDHYGGNYPPNFKTRVLQRSAQRRLRDMGLA